MARLALTILVLLVLPTVAAAESQSEPSPSRTYIGCGTTGAGGVFTVEPRHRPRNCAAVAEPMGVVLRRLRWRAWGSPVARARGRVLASGRDGRNRLVPIRVRAYRRVRVFDNDLCYTRLRVAFLGDVRRLRLTRCL